MKNSLKWALMLPLIASMSLISCTKEEDDPAPVPKKSPVEGKVLIFESTSTEAEVDVKVYADEALFTGYNRLYVMIYKTGTSTVIDDAHVTFETEMTMMVGHSHSSPIENPTDETPEDGLFSGAAVFVMPSEGNGSWTLKVHVHNHHNNLEGMVESQVTVVSPTEEKMYSFISDVDSSMIFVSLVEPVSPEVGLNDFEIVIHHRETGMSWPFVAGLMVEIEPEMPTMGHGSPGNVNPVYTSIGHYKGIVNFTMPGLWRVHITVKDASGLIMNDSKHLDMTF